MANEPWIKFRTKLIRDGRVLYLSRQLGISRNEVLGALLRVWALADEFADAKGVINGWTADDVDREVECNGLTVSLPEEWVDLRGPSVRFPDYQDRNGSTSKTRIQTSERVRRHRNQKKKLKTREKQACNAKGNANSVPVSSSSSSSYNSKRKDNLSVTRFDRAPIVESCLHFRATDEELSDFEKHLARIGIGAAHREKFANCCIEIIEEWLVTDAPKAVSARDGEKSHAPRLRMDFVIERAKKRYSLSPQSDFQTQPSGKLPPIADNPVVKAAREGYAPPTEKQVKSVSEMVERFVSNPREPQELPNETHEKTEQNKGAEAA